MEVLETEYSKLKDESSNPKKHYFRIEDIQDDDKLVLFYTGFVSYMVFSAFFEFLRPVVNNLNYWGIFTKYALWATSFSKTGFRNRFFLVLVKLKLNLKLRDLA